MATFAIAAALAAASVGPDQACAEKAFATPQVATVQGATMPYVHCGTGVPTIVFEGGFGGNLGNWRKILPRAAEFAPVFAYSRPGFDGTSGTWTGDSDGIRTSEEAARLLRDVLISAKIPPPYLLVGHSLGGLYIQKFAQLFPSETAGLVLIDNRPATLMRSCRLSGLPECKASPPSPDWSATLRSTYLGIESSEAVAPTPEALGAIPVLVLTAGKADEGVGEEFFNAFADAQGKYAARLKHGRQKTIAAATHSSLSGEYAEETVQEIRHFWSEIRK